MTLDDKLVFDLPCWDDVATHAKDLISKLLQKDPNRRISLAKAMEHPWFSGARARYEASLVNGSPVVTPMREKKSSFATRANNQPTAGALLD